MTRETHKLGWATALNETGDWLKARGYRCAMAAAPGSTYVGAVFSRPNEQLMMATMGDTLVWDGAEVTIEPYVPRATEGR